MPSHGTTTERGYGTAHQTERAKWEPRVAAGHTDCARCGQPINPDEPWDLGHNDDRSGWTGPEHRACNRREGGRNGNRVARERAQTITRSWW